MNRATFFRILFRILGFASLAFAVVSIYRGELRIDDQGDFVVGGTGGVVITSAHDPETFWRTITITIGLGCFFFLVSFARAGGSLTSPFAPTEGSLTSSLSAEERPELPNYDSDLCGKVVKGAACVCVGLIIAELLVLLLVHPSDDRCPGWIVHPNQPSAISLWAAAGIFTVLPALWACNVALRWDRYYARKMYDSILYGPSWGPLIDASWLVLIVMAGWCLFCAIPLCWMLGQCTEMHLYLSAFGF